jgi:hypothetical protein
MVQAPVSLGEEPKHRLVLENDRVRVFDVFIPGGEQTLLHIHSRDTVSVATRAASTWSETELGERRESTAALGRVSSNTGYSEAPRAHRVGNRGTTPYQLVLIEILTAPHSKDAVLVEGVTRGFTKVHEDENTVAYRLSLRPGETTGRHRFLAPALLIRLPDGAFDWIEEGSDRELQNPPDGGDVLAVAIVLK